MVAGLSDQLLINPPYFMQVYRLKTLQGLLMPGQH